MEIDPQNFFQDLTQHSKDDKYGSDYCQRLLDSLNRLLIEEQIDSSFIDIYLIHIFQPLSGLVNFIDTSVKIKCFRKASEKAVEILYTLVNNFPNRLSERNVIDILSLCTRIVKSDTDYLVKGKIFDLILITFEKIDKYIENKDVMPLYKLLLIAVLGALRQRHTDSVKHKELLVLGAYAKKYQYLVDNPQELKTVFWRNFETDINKREISQYVMGGFFTGFMNYCESFPLKLDISEDRKIVEKLYIWLKKLVTPTKKIKLANRAAITFLAHNGYLFIEKLLKEYQFWHTKLLSWLMLGHEDMKAGAFSLRAFFQVIAEALEEKDGDEYRTVVEYFNNWSRDILEHKGSTNYEKRLAIACLKLFSTSSHKHLTSNEVTGLFVTIMQNFERTYILNYEPESEDSEYLPDYVQTVANFMRFKTFTPDEFFCLQRAIINMIKSFHKLSALHYELVIESLLMTLFYLKKSQYFDVFLDNVIYQGVVWACSHQHIAQEAFAEETTEKIVTVKNYFPLWKGILRLTSIRSYDKFQFYLDDRKYILERIVNELVKTLMVLINKLNVSVKLKDDDIAITELEHAYTVEQSYDYAIFLNVIDFYQEIFNNIEAKLFKKCICKIIKHVISKCVLFPLISGFYKLLAFSLKIAQKLSLFKNDVDANQDVINCRETLTTFLSILLNKMTQYKDELSISCLQVLLETPVIIIKDMLPACITPFINIFNVGRSYLPLADMGLNTLEHWQNNIDPDDLEPFLIKIIPCLDTFLRSKSLGGQVEASMKKRRKSAPTLKKRKVLVELEPELIRIQRKILCFIGKQSLKNCQAFIFSDSYYVPGLISGQNPHLKVTLPYEDMHLDIYLDTFLPRVIDLALYCSDRKTRITACELLQATVMVFLGRAKTMSQSGLLELNNMLKALLEPILQLSCDIDQVVQQIFEPLFLQLIHWYSSPTQLRGAHTSILIDVLMDGITHPTNASLRDFSGKCVNEFVKWTIKQSNEQSLSKDPINIKVLVSHMRFFSSHPDSSKKLGAALIFNNIYQEIREEEALVNIFSLELLHIFINSLSFSEYSSEESFTVLQIKIALRHLQRVFVAKCYMFRTSDKQRRTPHDFKSGLLKDVAVWLLKQTGNKNATCRECCMELFIKLAPLASEQKMSLQNFVKTNFSGQITNIYDELLYKFPTVTNNIHSADCTVLLKWMQALLCVLDGYNFIIKNNLGDVSFENKILFNEMEYFLKHLQDIEITEALNLVARQTWVFTSIDKENFSSLKSSCILSVLKLINSVIHNKVICEKSDVLWTENVWKLIVNAVFSPHSLGINDVFQPTHFEILNIFLSSAPKKIPAPKISELAEVLRTFIENNKLSVADLKKNVPLKYRNIIRGLLMLSSSNINQLLKVEKYADGLTDALVQNFYSNATNGVIFVNELQETTFSYYHSLLNFSLKIDSEFEVLVHHFYEAYLVQSVEFCKEVTFGYYFLSTFADAVLPFVLKYFEKFLTIAISKHDLKKTFEQIRFILNQIIKDKSYKKYQKDVSEQLLRYWHTFVEYFCANENNMIEGLEYVKLLGSISTEPLVDIHNWLVQCLLRNDGKYYLEIFHLLVLTTDEDTTVDSVDLKTALLLLSERVIPEEFNIVTNCITFNKMLTSIPYVKSTIILKFLIQGYLKTIPDINIAPLLAKFMDNANKNLQYMALDLIYQMSCDENSSFEHRYKLGKEIIPHVFLNSWLPTFEQFYVKYISGILTKFEEENLEIKIVHFMLIEILFVRIPIGASERKDCAITEATGKPKLLPILVKYALDAFKTTSDSELPRLFKCHAYNALASMVSNSLKLASFYDKLFSRHHDNKDILWNGIINTSVTYDFPIFFESIPARRKILVNIRDERKKSQSSDSNHKSLKYIESQRLFNSSLSEDVTNFDFTNTVIRMERVKDKESTPSDSYQTEIHLDGTDINNHECMATICGLIQHIFDTGVNELPQEDEDDYILPVWMNSIRTTLLNRETHKNVKIFLVRLIDNMIRIFSQYSKSFLEPLLQFVVDRCAGDNINYFVTDVLIIISKWASHLTNLNERESQLATELVEFLVEKINKDRSDVFKYNLDLVKLIVEAWKSCIKAPTEILLNLISSEATCEVGIHLTSVFLVNDLVPWQENRENAFLELLLRKLNSTSKSVYKPVSETVGLVLQNFNGLRVSMVEKVDACLKKIQDLEKYVLCLEGITIHYPSILTSFHVTKLISTINQVPDNQKITQLRMICKRTEISLDILEEISDFQIVDWHHLLENANLEIQIISIEIVKKCCTVLASYENFPSIVTTLARNVTHPNALYRSCIFDLAILLYGLKLDDSGISKEILIFGLMDPDIDNQDKVIKFWINNSNLPKPVIDRFTYLLSQIYKSKIEDRFLGFVTYFLINVLNQSNDYDSTLFEHPLEDCDFEDYKLQTNWRLQHPSVVPMFAETQQTYDLTEFRDESAFNQIRKTQSNMEFTPTQSFQERHLSKFTSLESSLAVSSISSESSIKNPNTLTISQKYRQLKKVFLKDRSKISIGFAHYETQKKIKQVQRRIDSAKERERKVNIYRSYRKGDFPDIQIVLSSVLKPLQMLALHDNEVAKILFLEIFKGLASKVENNDEFLDNVSASIKQIFSSSTHFNANLFGALLDILLRNKSKIQFDPSLISYVCQESGLVSVGTLLLEEYLISYDDQPSSNKKGVGSQENKETLYWVKLAELYKELEEWDIVRSIFLEKMNCKETIQKAIKYESEAMWRNAQDLYKELLETDLSVERKDFYYESYFKCFANLGEWENLPNAISSVIDSDNTWDSLWDNGWYQQKLLPWYITAQVNNALYSHVWHDEFYANLNKCLSDPAKNEYLRENFSEELCIMWLCKKDIATASIYLRSCIRYFLDDWQLLNPMFQSSRYQKLLKLRNIIETDNLISVYNNLNDNLEDSLKELTKRWQSSSSEVLPSVLLNETRVLYRTEYINLLTDKISKFEGIDLREHMKNLKVVKIKLDIDLIDTAAEFGNYYISRKYFKKYAGKENLKLKIAYGNIAFLKSKMMGGPEQEIGACFSALNIFSSIFDSTNDQLVQLTVRMKSFAIFQTISSILSKNSELFSKHEPDLQNILGRDVKNPRDIELFASHLLKTAITNIELQEDMDCDTYKNTAKHEEISKSYVKLAYFLRDRNEENLQGDFITFVLRAMKMNSSDGRQLFPCVLMQKNLGDKFVKMFIKETERIPTWMFLGWIPQLLANVDSPKVLAISKVVMRIAETYPQAIMYPYRLSRENYNFEGKDIAQEGRLVSERLDNLLLNDEYISKFLTALSYISMPAGILRYYIRKIVKSEDSNQVKQIQNYIMDDVFGEIPDSGKFDNMQGNMFKKIQKFKKDFINISGIPPTKMKEILIKIDETLDGMLKTEKSLLLKDYCPWLANFSSNRLNVELEIPGQYDGQTLPLPQHHVKISGFRPNVTVMKSLRKPIKLTMIGMDTKEYPFLIKFGEDIRQDQRIEQLFGLMNNIFKNDRVCANNGLEILTYQVIPLTSNLGIIQWITDTEPLNDFIKTSLKNEKLKKDFEERIHDKYEKSLFRGKSVFHTYGMSAVKYNRNKVIPSYRNFVDWIPWDILRTSFWTLSINTENYIALRNNFIKSYSTLCVSQWLLGIGDRHLNNSLICKGNGKVLGIDFGHAFGTATQILPVPELVPFRLTPHMIGLMEPLKERGQFRECMIHCLRSLRSNSNSLLATMNVFVEEPSLDWLEHASKFENKEEKGECTWYPEVKIKQAERKLQGVGSVEIMIEDLRAGTIEQKYTEAYIQLVRGTPEFDLRARLDGNDGMTVEDQVDCLIDHATDYNLLGRMYAGWMPWI